MSLTSIDEKLFVFYALETFGNNFSSIGAGDIDLPPFDASGYDESKKTLFFLFMITRWRVIAVQRFVENTIF